MVTGRQVNVVTGRQVHVVTDRQVHVVTGRQVHVKHWVAKYDHSPYLALCSYHKLQGTSPLLQVCNILRYNLSKQRCETVQVLLNRTSWVSFWFFKTVLMVLSLLFVCNYTKFKRYQKLYPRGPRVQIICGDGPQNY